jgi:glycosyltransferase involved in cell wall biosynthesis
VKISIVTPSYNQGRFIGQCIESVRNQEGNFTIQHIILDNCSTDNTKDILDAYQLDPGRVEVTCIIEKDGGQTPAINKGFKLTTGDVVCWLNTDEWYHEGALAKVVDFFSRHPDLDVAFGDCDFVNIDGRVVKHKREYFYSKSMLIYYGCFLPSCATFVRRKVIDSGILLDPEFRVTMDFDWYVRIARAGFQFAHIRETLANFTWHQSNISMMQAVRRKHERRLVQDRYSGIKGPKLFRAVVYQSMQYFWMSVRVLRRAIV